MGNLLCVLETFGAAEVLHIEPHTDIADLTAANQDLNCGMPADELHVT